MESAGILLFAVTSIISPTFNLLLGVAFIPVFVITLLYYIFNSSTYI